MELVDHLAFGERDAPERHGEAELLGDDLDLDLTEAHLADEGMGAAEATLRGIGEAEQEALVAARQSLKAEVTIGRKFERRAGEVADLAAGLRVLGGLDRPSSARMSTTRGVASRGAGARAGAGGTPWPRRSKSTRRWV
jgi:hypothetical protein